MERGYDAGVFRDAMGTSGDALRSLQRTLVFFEDPCPAPADRQ
jgi:hypothetical protein